MSHATNNNQDQAHAMMASLANINIKEWFFDIGTTHHLSQTTSLDNLQSYNGNDKVTIGNGTQLPILHTGSFMSFLHTAKDVLILLIYVDNILVIGSDPHCASSFASRLNAIFALRDLGRLHYFLELEIMQAKNSVHLNQHKYVHDLLQRTSMLKSKFASTLGMVGQNLSKHDGDSFHDVTLYRSTFGALQYLTLTRPDISFVVNKACQFMSSLSNTHCLAVKCILQYLKGTASYGLSMQPSSALDIQAYTDVDWAFCLDDGRSTSGYCIFIRPNLVSWSSTKQKIISRSNAESEYHGLATATSEIAWIQSLVTELSFFYNTTTSMV
ncbi:uncharacterized mitochondrial protein AtMg00810-like [Vitis riparia]|uniref:uncharacterized mitochondrial protein AtMg00810-like n=1 Tax=Vitis riparia TaxID=96939 RepID=UPI00155A8AC7|nr:uncharacterized mitochondrial protein AtMg00810-like [Vitis riparia]